MTEDTISRDDHIMWCKNRAREYLARGDSLGAISSMLADLRQHPETDSAAAGFSASAWRAMIYGDIDDARRVIDGVR